MADEATTGMSRASPAPDEALLAASQSGSRVGSRHVKQSEMLIVLADYTLGNPDTLTKYKVAAEISQKVLKEVSGASCVLHADRDVV
jgi:hypothetical protein